MNPFRIGLFDSGVGGLSILKTIRQLLPDESTLYFADQIHVPYGPRRMEEIAHFSEQIARFLLEQGADIIVVACNTASAAALNHLRATFPDTPFVGLEPALKPAAEYTRSHVIAVLATPVTFQGNLFTITAGRIPTDIQLIEQTVPELVNQIEAGQIDHPATMAILKQAIQPLLERQADAIVLGCTHYPFAKQQIQTITGPGVRIIDPSAAVAQQVQRLLEQLPPPKRTSTPIEHILFSSADPQQLLHMTRKLTNLDGTPRQARWINNSLLSTA